MKKLITISTTHPALYGLLNADTSEGINIISEPPIQKRSIDWNIAVNIDITLTIDLTKITALGFAIWLLNHIGRTKREIETNINRKQIPVDQREAIEFITKEIDHEQQEQDKKD